LLLKALVIYADTKFIKHHNCILLEGMKATGNGDEDLLGRVKKDWHRNIDMAFSTKKYVYDDDKYTDLLLPLRINGRWMLLIVQLGELKLVVMVFEDWDPMEHKAFIETVAHTMKIEALDIQIRIRGKPLDEKKRMWPVDRVV
jgi:hypothetical protein